MMILVEERIHLSDTISAILADIKLWLAYKVPVVVCKSGQLQACFSTIHYIGYCLFPENEL